MNIIKIFVMASFKIEDDFAIWLPWLRRYMCWDGEGDGIAYKKQLGDNCKLW